MVDLLLAPAQAAGPVHQATTAGLHPAVHAHHRPAGHAVLALAAAGPPGEGDTLAGGNVIHPGTDLFHHAGALVAEDDGQGAGDVARHVVELGVAHAGGLDPHKQFTGVGRAEIQVLDLQRAARGA